MRDALETTGGCMSADAHHKPGLRILLATLGLDVEYRRAAGDSLFCRDADGAEVEVLDLVGGYGTLLLGHNHPELIAAAARFLASGRPNHTQGAVRSGAEQLASALSSRVGGDYCALFANSGAEAVEAAIKHALLETGGSTLIALDGAFHGKTFGAMQVTANPQFREPFGKGCFTVIRIEPNNVEALRRAFARADDLAGFLFEPIQGEAGIRPLTAGFAQAAAALCAEHDIPFIADECQTGMGRTGRFLAGEGLGVQPDYVILSKALGGGLAKISALLFKRERYRPDFDLLHSSTFADDELSCAIAAKSLELLNAEIVRECRVKGEDILDKLRGLQQRFPAEIADVRGIGLLTGIEFQRTDTGGFLLHHLGERDLLGPLIAAYLLREYRIRIAPTLSDSFTLRVQPSVLISTAQIDRFIGALQDVCEQLHANDVAGLTRFLLDVPPVDAVVPRLPQKNPAVYTFHRGKKSHDSSDLRRVAWLFHLVDENDLVHLEPAFGEFSSEERAAFLQRFAPLAEPVVMDPVDVRSAAGDSARLFPIVLPVTSAWLMAHAHGEKKHLARDLIQKGVDAAATLGCRVVALGQFTSTVTRGGKCLRSGGVHLTTGNNYTAALVVESIHRLLHSRDLDPRELTLAVVGAAGDIGRTCTAMLAPEFRRSILVGSGRAGSQHRLEQLARHTPGGEAAGDFSQVRQADVVVCATSSLNAPLRAEHLHPRAIVCDVSVPSTLDAQVAELLPDATIVPGAIVRLPFGENLGIPGFPLPSGHTYGCMAEALILGFEDTDTAAATSDSSPSRAEDVAELAALHGFTLANRPYEISSLPDAQHAHVD